MFTTNIWERVSHVSSAHQQDQFCGVKSVILGFFLLVLGFFGTLSAQSTQWENLDEYAWEILAPAGTFAAGDAVTFTLELGTPAVPLDRVYGIDLELTLADHVTLPPNFATEWGSSWLFDAIDASESHSYDDGTGILAILTERIDGVPRNGGGVVYTFTLICGEDSTPAASLIDDSGGHVLIDNVEMRQAPGKRKSVTAPVVHLEVQPLGADYTGGAWVSLPITDTVPKSASLSLAPGFYLLRSRHADGQVRIRKIWVTNER
ncbi:MAG: hypothetical protein AAF998_14255 [Bacteroidota bacterium]